MKVSELKENAKQVKVNLKPIHIDDTQKKIDKQKLKTASAKINNVRIRAKPVSTDELVSWIREDRKR